MSRWTIRRSSLVILSCLIFVILLILVLPNVDLPDTAFHRGTAPVVIHSQATSAPAAVRVTTPTQLLAVAKVSSYLQQRPLLASTVPNFLPILLHS
ncbi:MAG: hypothetical protein WCA16_07175, partial [Candidatus Sulfotelmatobacter sp.]